MKTFVRFSILAAVLIYVALAPAAARDDFGSWHALAVKVLDHNRWTLAGVTQVRLRDDSSKLFAYVLSPQATYQASTYLNLSLNYTWLPAKPSGGRDFRSQRRWEIEVNPRWPATDWLTFDLRNRLERRCLEGRSGTNERSRHQARAKFRLKGLGALESMFIADEIFHDYDAHRTTENRFIPAGLNFRASPQAVFGAYYMAWSVRGAGGWRTSHVVGTQLALSL